MSRSDRPGDPLSVRAVALPQGSTYVPTVANSRPAADFDLYDLVAEQVGLAMRAEGLDPAGLARRLGRPPAYVHKILEGAYDLTLEDVAMLQVHLGHTIIITPAQVSRETQGTRPMAHTSGTVVVEIENGAVLNVYTPGNPSAEIIIVDRDYDDASTDGVRVTLLATDGDVPEALAAEIASHS